MIDFTPEWEADFERLAYAYRSWPATDPKGIDAAYKALLAFVDTLIDEEREAEASMWSSDI